jgi:hypothetical protein
MSPREPVKVVLRSGPDGEVETPWAIPVGPNLFELDNIPFFAYGISLGDRFFAEPMGDDHRPVFTRIHEKCGNRTIRIIFDPPVDSSDESRALLDALVGLGCTYEGASPRYICINIPPSADFERVCCAATDAGVRWEHADPTYEEVQRNI